VIVSLQNIRTWGPQRRKNGVLVARQKKNGFIPIRSCP